MSCKPVSPNTLAKALKVRAIVEEHYEPGRQDREPALGISQPCA